MFVKVVVCSGMIVVVGCVDVFVKLFLLVD